MFIISNESLRGNIAVRGPRDKVGILLPREMAAAGLPNTMDLLFVSLSAKR
jgi:hypothetical protein